MQKDECAYHDLPHDDHSIVNRLLDVLPVPLLLDFHGRSIE